MAVDGVNGTSAGLQEGPNFSWLKILATSVPANDRGSLLGTVGRAPSVGVVTWSSSADTQNMSDIGPRMLATLYSFSNIHPQLFALKYLLPKIFYLNYSLKNSLLIICS